MKPTTHSGEGAKEIFERLWARPEPSVLRKIFKRLRGWSREDREDVIQRSRLRAWTLGQSIELGELYSFTAWACQVADWTCLEALRQHSRRSAKITMSPIMEFEDGSNTLDMVASGEPSALDWLLDRELSSKLRAAIDEMPPEAAKAVVLSIEDLSPAEIAERTGVSVGTVRGRLHRGRQWARRHIEIDGHPVLS